MTRLEKVLQKNSTSVTDSLGDPDGAGRVLISLTTSVVSGGGTVAAASEVSN